MKKIIMLIILIACLGMASCGHEAEIERSEKKPVSMFVEVEQATQWRVVYHRETKVMYAVSEGSYGEGIFIVLVYPDGTPMLYEED